MSAAVEIDATSRANAPILKCRRRPSVDASPRSIGSVYSRRQVTYTSSFHGARYFALKNGLM
jgi:hypothetical protein